jgi:hypothetical protein
MIEIKITGDSAKEIQKHLSGLQAAWAGGDEEAAKAVPSAEKAAEAIQPAPAEKPRPKAAPAEKAKPKTERPAPKAEGPEAEEAGVTLADVKQITANALRAGYREEVLELLGQSNARNVDQLAPESYAGYLRAVEGFAR